MFSDIPLLFLSLGHVTCLIWLCAKGNARWITEYIFFYQQRPWCPLSCLEQPGWCVLVWLFSFCLACNLLHYSLVVNHIGIFIVIRRHNRQVVEALSGNSSSVIFRREKKAAIDMIIVIAVLLLCLAPGLAVDMLRYRLFFPDKFDVLCLWCTSLLYLNSTINPVIYLVRKTGIRHAVKSILSFWLRTDL